MSLSSEMADDWDEITAEVGVTCTLGAGGTLLGVLTYEDDFDTRRPVLEIHAGDLGTIDHGSTIAIAGVTYWVEGYRPTSRDIVRLNLRRA